MTQPLRIKDMPDEERPRERLVKYGARHLRKSELIAILLRTGLQGKSAIQVGEELIAKFKTLDNLSRATIEDLREVKGIGRDKAVTLVAAFTLARLMVEEVHSDSPMLDNPELIANLLREENRSYKVEQFQVVLLNTRRRLIRVEIITEGTIDTAFADAREVFKPAIAAKAAALVLVHNHPSGDPSPSEADIKVTRDLIRAGKLLKIDVLDHVILGRKTQERQKDWSSLRELGYFYS